MIKKTFNYILLTLKRIIYVVILIQVASFTFNTLNSVDVYNANTSDALQIQRLRISRTGISFRLKNLSNYRLEYIDYWVLEHYRDFGHFKIWEPVPIRLWSDFVRAGHMQVLVAGEIRAYSRPWELPPGKYRFSHSFINRNQPVNRDPIEIITIEFTIR